MSPKEHKDNNTNLLSDSAKDQSEKVLVLSMVPNSDCHLVRHLVMSWEFVTVQSEKVSVMSMAMHLVTATEIVLDLK